ncbi:MAG: WG repeat-containing protein [Pirellulaceae bacterium]
MRFFIFSCTLAALVATMSSCSGTQQTQIPNTKQEVQPLETKEINTDTPNASGFAITRIREGDSYKEGVVDSKGAEIIPASTHLLVKDLTGSLALINVDRKFLFVPLEGGAVLKEEIDSVKGFQYAEPFQCGHALVVVDDRWFYIDSKFEKAFGLDFEFAETFHHDRALVKSEKGFQIIDNTGKIVADLNFDQVNPQSPWFWQVTKIENKRYRSGFVDLNGKLITDVNFDDVGYYQPDVKRLRVTVGDLHGFLNEHAHTVIPIQYEHAEIFDRGKARVRLNGRSFFINNDGVEVPE